MRQCLATECSGRFHMKSGITLLLRCFSICGAHAVRGARRIVFGAASIAILGIPALLYFPTWVLGAVIYHLHQKVSVTPRVAAIGTISTGLLLIGLLVSGAFGYIDTAAEQALNNWPSTHLHSSMNFPSHYVGGLLSGAHIFVVRYCRLSFVSGERVRSIIVYAASFTFARYLSHRPLMNIWSFLIGHDPHSIASIFILADLVLFSCWCFGWISERQKDRWRSFFRFLLGSKTILCCTGHSLIQTKALCRKLPCDLGREINRRHHPMPLRTMAAPGNDVPLRLDRVVELRQLVPGILGARHIEIDRRGKGRLQIGHIAAWVR